MLKRVANLKRETKPNRCCGATSRGEDCASSKTMSQWKPFSPNNGPWEIAEMKSKNHTLYFPSPSKQPSYCNSNCAVSSHAKLRNKIDPGLAIVLMNCTWVYFLWIQAAPSPKNLFILQIPIPRRCKTFEAVFDAIPLRN